MTRNVFMTLGLALLLAAAPASGTLVTLQDRNATATFDTGSQAGMSSWTIDGVNQMFQQWFWFRTGAAGGEQSLNTLTETGLLASDTNPFVDPNNDALAGLWTGNGFTIEVNWLLRGGNPGSFTSDVTEAITIRNTGETALDFHFFQYSDFNLGGVGGNQGITIDPNHQIARQTGAGLELTETIVTPAANFAEADVFANTRDRLNDASATTLNNVLAAFGDATWAFQWDVAIAPGGSFQISKDKLIALIPAPGAIVLGALGLALVQRLRRRMAA